MGYAVSILDTAATPKREENMKYAYNTLVYGEEPIEKSIERIANCGYDGVEFVGEPQKLNTNQINKLLDKYKIKASSICSIFFGERDLVNPDPKIRENTIQYMKDVVDMAAKIGAPTVIIVPSPVGKTTPLAPADQEWKWAVDNIRKCGEYAGKHNINLVIEAWNRYETYFVNRLDQAVKLCSEVELDNVGIMGDTFHMNIEEESIAEALRKHGDKLIHVHIADSNRAAPGRGHIEFRSIVRALKDIDYQGYLSFELLPAAADPFRVMREKGGKEFYGQYTAEAIKSMKRLFDEL